MRAWLKNMRGAIERGDTTEIARLKALPVERDLEKQAAEEFSRKKKAAYAVAK